MSDRTQGLAAGEGGTSWRRSALVLIPGLVGIGALTVAMAQGAVATAIGVSSQDFSITADAVESTGLELFPSTVKSAAGKTSGTILLGQKSMTVRNMCMVAKADLPVIGKNAFVLRSGEGSEPVAITNFVSTATSLDGGTGTLTNVAVGQDASTLVGPAGVRGRPGDFGMQAEKFNLDHLTLQASSVAGGSFKLAGLKASLQRGSGTC